MVLVLDLGVGVGVGVGVRVDPSTIENSLHGWHSGATDEWIEKVGKLLVRKLLLAGSSDFNFITNNFLTEYFLAATLAHDICRRWQRLPRTQSGLDGFGTAFAGTDADAIVHREDENFAISDLAFFAGFGSGYDGVDGWFDEVIIDRDLQLDFAEQVDRDFVAAIGTDLPLLSTEALAVEDRQAEHFDFG